MTLPLRPFLIALAVATAATPALSQDVGVGDAATTAATATATQSRGPAVLVADSVRLDGRDTLIAEGHVEALQGDTRLTAQRIIYDRKADNLILTGPITITQGDRVVVLADQGQMDSQLQNGLLTGARMVLDQQVQLAATQIDRVGGRYTQLYKTAVTSCRVCGQDTAPLWQIRAEKVVHDQQERQLYFTNAQLRLMDVPVLWTPRLRLPDPTLKRASGFLIPSMHQSSELGLGLKMPYFIRIGSHKDLTLTPFISTNTRTLEFRYRQAFRTGRIEFNGALSNDDLGSYENPRGYLFGEGRFDLRNDYKLSFALQAVSDKAYLTEYGYSDADRLKSELALTRARRDEFTRASLVTFQSLRTGEDNATIPTIVADIDYERRYFPRFGGELRLGLGAHSHYRYSSADIVGRDLSRADASVSWRRNWTLGPGILATFDTGLAIDGFLVEQDSTSVDSDTELRPHVAATLRWPWMKTTARGTAHIIEPVLMMGWVGGQSLNVPNDESTRVEFDEGNLLDLSRFPAPDRYERGAMMAYGVNWSRQTAAGWGSTLSLGRIMRADENFEFTRTSGLSGLDSGLLVAGQLRADFGLNLTARAIYDDGAELSKAEARAAWARNNYGLGASYVWLGADTGENRPSTVSEWSVDGYYRFARHWTSTANWRYDVASDRTAEAGLGLQYRNECIEVNLSLSRRFTSSTILTPSTDFDFTVGLLGFTAKTGDKTYTRTCKN
ncbi:MAG: LPS-assembly protein LptD [Paracoccaceae bacterium]